MPCSTAPRCSSGTARERPAARKKTTTSRAWKTRKKPEAIDAAHRLILEEYQQIAPTSETVGWDAAKAKLTEAMAADGKRPKTIQGYLETLDKLTALFPLARGPADVSDRMAGDFKTKYATGKFTRKRTAAAGE